MKRTLFTLFLASVLASPVQAATVEVTWSTSPIGPEAVAAGAPDGGFTLDAFVTTDADILSIGNVLIETSAPLFQVPMPFGTNITVPDPLFIQLNRALEADSWITTPGSTSILGPDMDSTDGTSTWGDLSNDGPQNIFQFARLGLPAGTTGRFSGRVSVAGSTGPERFAFSIPIVPEPTSLLLMGMGLLGWVVRRR